MSGINPRGARVLITGASSGIGAATARAFATHGARVVISGRNQERLSALAAELTATGRDVHAVRADVTSTAEQEQLVTEAERLLGGLDIAVANAGIGLYRALLDTPEDELRAIFETNFYGVLRTVRAAAPALRRSGRGQIILISSILGKRATPFAGGYAASKFALQAVSESLRVELRPEQIEVLVVYPGYTQTEFQRRAINAGGRPHSPARPMPAAEVGEEIVRASARGTRERVLTLPGRAMALANKIAPALLDRILGRALRRAD